ncbi:MULTISPECIES: symmetrical bis(5'-nucleosyl)-tetraphosphatase [unclassified Oceanobacter]|uniref:symmetrical bis(5'-nucleosyl)-tetraphosphatase n=1 Tax=unclassified Oceanobacter TaxID=2620260 RepID=UPI0026E4074B|nr:MULTISPECIES: symmetrical bis(5'-nucleosyl)-tetraphosphatase [unclassified Oceanobacter]MDO6681937.1 symmetrical bis(5'-nucleosyl)-tetraphosphatase [Oceanobacter sp. 5_MG-2023]MDP2505299.1 symmetrical bis(5'-nucleosyl)-tetraphosphatase [Oceanobacter sp. 3_MG-2023]MDP2547973.1 symmetrical bis(5'-nucleosyl)-tetraphosphatase [Oceanobacter sp. 4_MG-2023]
MTTYAIGDIQGCYEPLQRLLDRIEFDPQHDQLWLAGDLVNRGPQSLEVLRWAKSLGDRVVAVLGNHDLHLLARYYGNNHKSKKDTLDAVLTAPDRDELMYWLRHRPLVHLSADKQWCMSHAGIPPFWSAAHAKTLASEVEQILQGDQYSQLLNSLYGNKPDQWDEHLTGTNRWRAIVNYLTRMRFIDAHNRLDFSAKEGLDSAPAGFMPWFEASKTQTRLVFGHWAALNGEVNHTRIDALDTGCVWGGSLTAMRLDNRQRYAVPAHP